MPQNIYDNSTFFAQYSRMREEALDIPENLEQPAIRGLLTNVRGKRVLDMGCGTGVMSRWLAEQGAATVLGVDISERMIEKAMELPDPKISYMRMAAEELDFPEASFDIVASSMMFHYVDDLATLFTRIHHWLNPDGKLVFSTEHPVFTSTHGVFVDRWTRDENGNEEAWKLDRYLDEGKRVSTWFVDGVVRYHRTISTLMNSLVDAGFNIKRVLEPPATEDGERKSPFLLEERKRPTLIFIAADAV